MKPETTTFTLPSCDNIESMVLVKILSVLLVIVALSFLEAYLNRRNPLKAAEKSILGYGFPVKVVILIVTMGFLWLAYYVKFQDPRSISLLLRACLFIFLLLCFALLLETFLVCIRFNDRGIFTSSPWRPSRKIPWHSIVSYRWSENLQWHVLETRGYGKVRLSPLLLGLSWFFGMLEEKRPDLFGEDEPT